MYINPYGIWWLAAHGVSVQLWRALAPGGWGDRPPGEGGQPPQLWGLAPTTLCTCDSYSCASYSCGLIPSNIHVFLYYMSGGIKLVIQRTCNTKNL